MAEILKCQHCGTSRFVDPAELRADGGKFKCLRCGHINQFATEPAEDPFAGFDSGSKGAGSGRAQSWSPGAAKPSPRKAAPSPAPERTDPEFVDFDEEEEGEEATKLFDAFSVVKQRKIDERQEELARMASQPKEQGPKRRISPVLLVVGIILLLAVGMGLGVLGVTLLASRSSNEVTAPEESPAPDAARAPLDAGSGDVPEAAPTEAAPTEAAPTEAAPTEAAPTEAAPSEPAEAPAASGDAADGDVAGEAPASDGPPSGAFAPPK